MSGKQGMILGLLMVALLGISGCGEVVNSEKPAIIPYLTPEPLRQNIETETATLEEQKEDAEAEGKNTVSVTITAAGDVTLGAHAQQDYESSFLQVYQEADTEGYFFENVYDIFSGDDFTLVNLEGPLTCAKEPREGQKYSIKGDPAYAGLLVCGDIEAVGMGNNHRLDYGKTGSDDTIKALKDVGIVYAYDDNVAIYEVEEKGIQIGFVSVNEVSNGWIVEKQLEDGIKKLREQGADLVLASCHWGAEKEYYPEDFQKNLGKKCINWGADLVLGHHPHVLQGIEEYNGKFIVYSLGNFCFGANRNPEDKDAILFQQTFTFVEGEKKEDKEIKIIPCSISSVTNKNDFKPTPAAGTEAERIIEKVNELSTEFGISFDQDGYLEE